jgi:hypothetical protein
MIVPSLLLGGDRVRAIVLSSVPCLRASLAIIPMEEQLVEHILDHVKTVLSAAGVNLAPEKANEVASQLASEVAAEASSEASSEATSEMAAESAAETVATMSLAT